MKIVISIILLLIMGVFVASAVWLNLFDRSDEGEKNDRLSHSYIRRFQTKIR